MNINTKDVLFSDEPLAKVRSKFYHMDAAPYTQATVSTLTAPAPLVPSPRSCALWAASICVCLRPCFYRSALISQALV